MAHSLSRDRVRSGPSRSTTQGLRLVLTEVRKQLNTRAGQALLVGSAAVLGLVYLVGALGGTALDLEAALSLGLLPLGLLLPIIAIMGVTGEWTQRNAQVTFILEPRRGRVLAAKILASMLLALGLLLLSTVAGTVATLVASLVSGEPAVWRVDPIVLLGLVAVLVLGTLQAAAFAALLHSTTAAIVAFLVLPTGFSFAVVLVPGVHAVVPWIDLNSATAPLTELGVTALQLLQLATAMLLWIVLPLGLGWWRSVTREP